MLKKPCQAPRDTTEAPTGLMQGLPPIRRQDTTEKVFDDATDILQGTPTIGAWV